MRRFITRATAIVAACALPSLVVAQDRPAPRAVVVSETFTIPYGEFIRVQLAGGVEYRAELGGRGMRIQLRPVQSGVPDPDVRDLLPGASAGGTTVFTIRPRVDAEYEFRTVGGEFGRAVTIKVTRLPARPEKKDSSRHLQGHKP